MGQSLYFKVREEPSLIGHMDLEDSGEERAFNEEGVKSFTKMINYCKGKGIDVLLVRAPRHDWTWADYEGLQKFADEHGVPYLDMNTDEIITEMGIDSKTDMSNKHHLNYKGAEKMTRWLGDYITEHYDIDTTDATDSTKAQMKENVEYYDEVVAKYAK